MLTAEHFEDAIFANPEDAATYRVYADWLLQNGEDDSRAQLISWQLKLERNPASVGGLNDFIEENRAALLGTLARGLEDFSWTQAGLRPQVRFRRGFVHTLVVPWPTDSLAKALAGWSHRRFLRELVIQDLCHLWGNTTLALTALSAWMEDDYPGVERLVLEHTWEQMPSAEGLDLSSLVVKMPALRALEVHDHPIDAQEMKKLFSLDLSAMRSLSVPYTGESEQTLEVLLANESAADLQQLALYPIEDLEGARPANFEDLLSYGTWLPPGLQSLRFSGFTGADAASCASMGERVGCTHLRTLDLSDGDIDDAGASALAKAAGIAGRTWVLRGNRVTPEGINVLRQAGARVVS